MIYLSESKETKDACITEVVLKIMQWRKKIAEKFVLYTTIYINFTNIAMTSCRFLGMCIYSRHMKIFWRIRSKHFKIVVPF